MSKQFNYKYNPDPDHLYFYFNSNGDGFTYFKTEQERDEAAKEAIQDHLSDGWNEEVTDIVTGKVTSQAAMTDVQLPIGELDEEGCDGSGEWWDDEWDYKCNYELKPIGFVCPSTKVLKDK